MEGRNGALFIGFKGKIVMPLYLGPGIESGASKASLPAVNIRGMNRDS